MSNLVKFRFYGDITKSVNSEWNLRVDSPAEGFAAINTLTNNSFSDYFLTENKINAKYRVLINGRDFYSPVKDYDETNAHLINQSELVMKKGDLKTVDFVPVLESSDFITPILIAVGSVFVGAGSASAAAVGFIALTVVFAGVAFLLARPPDFGKFRSIDKNGNESYLFGGPVNIIGEGGPVPIGYGSPIVGSQVISSAYKIQDYQVFRDDIT